MIYKLIRKDLLLHRLAIYGYAPFILVYVAYLATELSSQNTFIMFTCIISTILPMVLITREDKFGSDAFICSLPVTRRQIVQAKYSICWIAAIASVASGICFYSFIGPDGFEILSFSAIGRALLILSLGLGFILPFSLRFGWMGVMIVLVGTQVLGIVALILAKSFVSGVQIEDVFVVTSNLIEKMHSVLGGPLFLGVTLILLAVFNFASLKIAEILYSQREF